MPQTSDDRTTTATVEIDGETIPNLTSFSYSSDVLQIGDAFSVEIPDPRGKYIGKLPIGATCKFYLQNPAIADGVKTLKALGVITDRKASGSDRGTIIRITGADIGWHLVHNPAPVWFNLRGVTWERLATAAIFPHQVFKGKKGKALDADPKWGFTGVEFGNGINRGLKLNNKRTEAQHQFQPLDPLFIQAEPGEKIIDILITYAQRLNGLINVSVDGKLQIFRPDYDQKARYRIEHYPAKGKTSKNNSILGAELEESLESTFTDVRVYGERVKLTIEEEAQRRLDPNIGKFNGKYPEKDPGSLPFTHRSISTDHDPTGKKLAKQRARWKYERGLFDAWTYTVTLRGHGQDGVWFESDTLASVVDQVIGVKGIYYVASVQCSRDQQNGDRTVMVLKRKGLLAAV
jgi:prophage tail gpP-like protein